MGKKVFWTDAERMQMVKRAVDIQSSGSGLTGLPLLREAIKVLPEKRQRRVIALSQAKWFQRMVSEETRRRSTEAQAEVGNVRAWQKHIKEALGTIVLLLQTLVGEVQEMNEKVAPMIQNDLRS